MLVDNEDCFVEVTDLDCCVEVRSVPPSRPVPSRLVPLALIKLHRWTSVTLLTTF